MTPSTPKPRLTRSQFFARLLRIHSAGRSPERLDSLYGPDWRVVLEDLAELRLVSYRFTKYGDVKIYVRKQIAGRTRQVGV